MKFQPNRCLKYNTIVSEEEGCPLSDDHCGQLHIMDDEHADQASPSSNSNTPPETTNGILHSDEASRSPSRRENNHNLKVKPHDQQPILLKKLRGESVAQLAVKRVVNGFGDHSLNKHTKITQLPEEINSNGTIELGKNNNITQTKKPDSITGSTYQLPPSPEQNNKNNVTITNSTAPNSTTTNSTTNNSTTIPNHLAINSTNNVVTTATALVNSGTYITPPQSPNCEKKLKSDGEKTHGNVKTHGNLGISSQNCQKSPENIQQSTPTKTRTVKIAPKLSFSKTREIRRLQKQHESSNAKSVQFQLKKSYHKTSVGVQSDTTQPSNVDPSTSHVSTSCSPHLFADKHHLQASAFKILTHTKPENKEVQQFHPLYKILPPSARPEIKLCKSQLFQQRQELLAESDINSMVKNGARSVQSHEEIMKMYVDENQTTSSDSDLENGRNLENTENQQTQTLTTFQKLSTSNNLNFDTLADSLQNALNIQKHRYLHKHDVMKMVPRRELFPKRMLEPGSTDKIIPTKLEDSFTEKTVKRAAIIQQNTVQGNTAKVLWQGLSSFTSKDDLQAAFRFAEDESQRMKNGGNGLVPDSGFNRIFGGSLRGSDGAVIEISSKNSKNTGLKIGGGNKRGRDGNPRGFKKQLERLRVKEIMTPEYNKISSSTVPSISSSRFSGNSVQNLNSPPVIELGSKNMTSSSFSVLFGQNHNPGSSSSNSNQHFTQTPNLHHSTKFLPESRKRELLNNRVYEKNHETPKNEERKRIFAFHDCNSNPSTRKGGGGVARSGVANSLPDFISARQTPEPSIQFFTKSGKIQNNFEESSLYMRGRHRLDLDDTNGYRKPSFPVGLLERKTLKIVGLQEKKEEQISSSKKRVLSDFSSSEEEEEDDFSDSRRGEVVHQLKPRHKRSRKLSERKLLSLEQEKHPSSRRKTIAGGEERGNKRGHKPNQKQKREWKLSESGDKSKDKLKITLKFKHRKKD